MPVSPGSKYQATTGYDMASGLGSPIAARLFPALCGDVVTVPATADIFAAGMSSPPNLAGGGGTLPPALTVNAVTSSMYMFSAAGLVNCGAGPWVGPQGAPCAGGITDRVTGQAGVLGTPAALRTRVARRSQHGLPLDGRLLEDGVFSLDEPYRLLGFASA